MEPISVHDPTVNNSSNDDDDKFAHIEPTIEPIVEPTEEPTDEPAVEPAVEPSTQPSTQPTVQPLTEHMEVDDTEAAGNGPSRDMSKPVASAVSLATFQCGAACVLGTIVGEWLVYGTGATIKGSPLWLEMLTDFGFSLLFGFILEYAGLQLAAPNERRRRQTVWRAVKVAGLGVFAFELVVSAWKVAFQKVIFEEKLRMDHVTYWFMIQVGMFFAYFFAFPVHWWLISQDQGLFRHLWSRSLLRSNVQVSGAH
ncbi:hypothetical protein K490DRAFT_58340 [Saccharata proteae CBS 121410]|uniref:DUF4396 domain-containing protein n=1 Tax=Saccharata proteae CBS 121410 TaxID=1314787 RepID=A0A9P4HU32_9PEZI|nr:hypothetical protein K490DRAFT_58340 [Saccharata proteae CBS 121410]